MIHMLCWVWHRWGLVAVRVACNAGFHMLPHTHNTLHCSSLCCVLLRFTPQRRQMYSVNATVVDGDMRRDLERRIFANKTVDAQVPLRILISRCRCSGLPKRDWCSAIASVSCS